MSKLHDAIQSYYTARRHAETLRREAADAEIERRRLEQALVDVMLEEKVNSLALDDGTRPTLHKQVNISVTKDNFDNIREWLLTAVGDDKDFLETVVSKPAVLRLVKDRLKEGYDESEFPAVLRVSTRPGIRVAGWQGAQDAEE